MLMHQDTQFYGGDYGCVMLSHSVFLLEDTDPLHYDLLQWPCSSVINNEANMNNVLWRSINQLCCTRPIWLYNFQCPLFI